MNNNQKSKYHLSIVDYDIVKPVTYFCQIYRSLIAEKYDIFPVPDKLINSMVQFVLTSKPLEQKKYLIKDIDQKYCKNWKYYHTFKYNIERMLKKNLTSNITLIKFSTLKDLDEIFKKYPAKYLPYQITTDVNAVIYEYSQNFDLCLLVNITNEFKFGYYKAIQHQLIHWMQVILNAQSHMTHGIFNDFKKSLTYEDLNFLYECFPKKQIRNTFDYVLNSIEFQAWCANAVENFEYLNLDLLKFKKLVENQNEFKKYTNNLLLNEFSQYQLELLMFAQICYIASKNNPADDRYWYLIEAIKENSR